MKKIILLIIASCTVAMATAQKKEHFTFATSVGTGIDMSEPAATPFSLQVLGYYAINKRFSLVWLSMTASGCRSIHTVSCSMMKMVSLSCEKAEKEHTDKKTTAHAR